jgi:hypothetical protein
MTNAPYHNIRIPRLGDYAVSRQYTAPNKKKN